ncbi:hypothetical protein [Ferrimonas sp. SCSIO 43195]|uniref:hypothetical protein n=1 Tax=Ferrimonas sp. SCSIO 43195 TaxID=2822844 RepID=UPI0020764466|nr:hypothetical protein [Ferrimonas sp. SCSIO 43195]USD38946.1 hypothetical protein J8Z22_07540 [Ferrimonas sp. SCSIO 43195]
MRALPLILLGTALPAQADSLRLDWDWQLSAAGQQPRNSVLFAEPQQDHRHSVDALLELEFQHSQWLGSLALRTNNLVASDDAELDADLLVRELTWQGSLSSGDLTLDLTLGKSRIDWGVGYGYRPLDIFKGYRRNPIGIQVEEGVGAALLSHFDLNGEWTLIYTDSSWVSQTGTPLEQASEQQGVGLRRYWLDGDQEYQLIGYYDDVRHGLLGASWVNVLGLAWELHASALIQRHYYGYQLPDDPYQPAILNHQQGAGQALVGFTWANETGHNVIMEYWYDSRSWSQSQWQLARQRAVDHQGTPWQPLSYSYAQGYWHANIVRHNLLAHWSLDSSGWHHWDWSHSYPWLQQLTPTLDLLYAPEDHGLIATQWLSWQAIDDGDNSLVVELAARFSCGASDSAYHNLPDKRMILLNLKGRF